MSTTVDERVVEMRFDNKHFESNVATSMSTLDKLKQKLNLSGASKGLEDIDRASKKVNMSGLGGAVESVSAKFSALQVIGVTALANITNSAVNAGKQLIKSLSVDQLTAGWQKFSDKTTSVATLVAQGNAIEDVNDQLDRLNWFTDETSYNFTEMVSNIAKFTATGKGLNESVDAMEGIATWAALSGQNAATASRAMYQLSQAMGAGVMRLEDYKSIQNASMDTEEFRQKCLDAGVALGTLKENGDGTYSSLVSGASGASFGISQFATNLTKEMWLTSDVMMKVFNDYSAAVDGIYEVAESKGMLASEIIDEIYTTAEKKGISTDEAIKSLGYDFDSFALKAFEAAQKARTFQDAIDSVKDAVSTGWMKTFEIIFGDAEKATELWTDLANTLYDVFAAGGEVRNTVLEFALNFTKPWESIKEKLNGGGLGKVKEIAKSVETIGNAVKGATDKLEYFQDIVNKVWRGDFNNWGDNPDRRDLLKEAGYDYRVVQELVNKGYQYKLTVEDVEAAHKKFGLTLETSTEQTKKTTDATNEATKSFGKLTDEQLEQSGLTEDEIDLYRALEKEADRLGISVSELADDMSKNDGRTLLIESFKNAFDGLLGIGKAIKEAWADIFNPPGVGELAIKIYGIIKSLNKFSEKLRLTDKETGKLNENGEKLKRTFKGIWAIINIITTVVGGAFKAAFKVVSEVLKAFDLNILDVTASIGDILVAFRDWLLQDNFIIKGIKDLIAKLPDLISKLKEWFAVFKETPAVQKLVKAIESISNAFEKLRSGEIDLPQFAASLGKGLANAVKSLPGIALQIGKDFIAGFQNGIGDSIKGVIKKIIDFCTNFVSNFASALGVHSPSVKAYAIAKDFFQGFINGAKSAISGVISFLKKIGEQIVKVFKSLWDFLTDESGNIDWGKIFAGGSLVALILVLKKFSDVFGAFAGILDSVQGLIGQASATLQSFGKVLNAVSWDLKAEALKKMAISIAILVASIWLLTRIDDVGKLWNAVGVIAVLAVILIGLSVAMDKLSSASVKWNKGPQIEGIKSGLLQIGIVILLLAAAVKMIGSMKPEQAEQGFKALAGIAVGMLAFMAAMAGISRYAGNVKEIGKMMKDMAIAMLLMVVVCKLAGNLSAEQMLKGAAFATGFVIFVKYLVKATESAGANINKVGGMMIKLAFAMALMVGVCKLAGLLTAEDMFKAAHFAAGFVIFVAALVKVTKISSEQKMAKISGLILSISLSLLMLVGVCKLVGMLSVSEMIKGGIFISAFLAFVVALVAVLKISNKQKMAEVSKTIMAMSLGIAVLAGVCVLLSFLDTKSLAKGIIAVGMLSLMMSLMVHSLKGAKNAKDAMKWMAISIVAMAAAVVALSFIDDKSLAKAVGSMVALMGMFALMMKSLKGLTKVPIGPIIMMIGVIVALTGVMYLLGELDPKTTISTVASLAILMFAMAGILKILSGMNSNVKKAFKGALSLSTMVIPLFLFAQVLKEMTGLDASIKNVAVLVILTASMAGLVKLLDLMSVDATKAIEGIIALSLMVVPLLLFVHVLKKMSGVEDAVTSVKALVILMSVLTLLLLPLSLVGALIYPALLGIVALTAMAVPMLVFIAILKKMNGIENATTNIELLLGLMTVMTDLLVKIALVGPLAVIGVTAMYGLVALMGVLGLMATAIGAIMTKFPSIQKFLGTGLPVLEQLAGSIGRMIGNFVTGFTDGIGSSLVKMGANIAAFMDQLSIASANASGIKSGSFDGAKDLMGTLLAIGGTAVGTSITDIFSSLFSGQTSIEKFETDSVAFFNAMKQIGKASSGVSIDKESFDSIVIAAQSLADLQDSIQPMGGVISFFTGRSDLATFGDSIVPFIRSMKMSFKVLDGVTLDKDAFEVIMDAAKALADLQGSLEPIGGVVSWFTGRDDLGTFGENIVSFIESMKQAFSTLEGVTLDSAAFESVITAATELAKLQSSLEPIGGVVSWFKGRDDLGTFGENVAEFIASMRVAFAALDGATLDSAALESVIIATQKLSELRSCLEPIGGVVSWFKGRDDLGKFGEGVASFAEGMKKLSECGVINSTALDSMVTAGTKLSDLQSVLDRVGGVWDFFAGRQDLETFGTGINAFAIGMKNLSECGAVDATAFDSIVAAATRLSDLQSVLDRVGGVWDFFAGRQDLETFGNGISSFANGMKSISEVGAIDVTAFDSIITAATKLSELQSELDRVGGVAAFFAGDNDLATFGTNVASFMSNMKVALSAISGLVVDETAFESINTAATKLSELQSELDRVGGVAAFFAGDNDLATFGTNIASFMTDMKKAFSVLDGMTLDTKAFASLTVAVEKLTELQEKLEPVGGVITWFAGRSDLGTFGQNVALFADGMMKLEQCEGFNPITLTTILMGANMLNNFQSKLEGTIGGVVNWFKGKQADLGTFGTSIGLFADGMAKLKDCEGLNLLTIIMITKAAGQLSELQSTLEGTVGGIVNWFKGKQADLGIFGANIGLFADGMAKLKNCEGLNPLTILTITKAARSLKAFQDELDGNVGGIISWFAGKKEDLGTFGANIGVFADAMLKLKECGGIDQTTIDSITTAGTAINTLQQALPTEHWFDGKMNLTDFSEYIEDFSAAMTKFSEAATSVDSGAVWSTIAIANRVKSFIESLADFDDSGVEKFTGIGTGGIGADGPAYKIAKAVSAFSDKITEVDTVQLTSIINSTQRIRNFIESLVGLDTSGIESFKPDTIATAMKKYGETVSSIDTSKVSSSISSANRLKNFIASLNRLDSSGISSFKPAQIGLALKGYAANVSGVNPIMVNSSIISANKIGNFISRLSSLNTSGVGSFKNAVNQLAGTNVAGLVKAFSGASSKMRTAGADMILGLINGMKGKLSDITNVAKQLASAACKAFENASSDFNDIGTKMTKKLKEGFESGKKNVKSAATSCANDAKSGIRDKYDSFYNAGSYLVTGFSNGISENSYKATAKSKAMAEAAIKAAREALKINSPSKVFKEIGSGIPEGFAMGIGMLNSTVKRSVSNMASTAITSTRTAMSTVLEALNSDMDAQPTIRPVVDLSDVRSGANAINGMLSGTQGVGVQANLNAINVAMNRKLQNGSNDDVISAINKLNDGLASNRGDTYNFGGITYDSGDEISNAVQTLVRAAKMGRRV